MKKQKVQIAKNKVISTKKSNLKAVKVITKPSDSKPPEVTINNSQPISENFKPQSLSFYGHTIRNTFMNNQWYFSLEDLLRVADIVDPTKFLINLKNTDNLKDRYYSLVETFSYYEGDSPIIIPIVNYQNFMELLPSIRAMEYFMPGPLPDWLKNMANRSL